MRRALVALGLLASGTARAQDVPTEKAVIEETTSLPPPAPTKKIVEPIRVNVECQTDGRTKVCPSFLWAIIEANPVLIRAPRAVADVSVYVNVNQIGNNDRVQLRFVGRMANAPAVIEIESDVDTRATDDEQRQQIEPAFVRGLALYVGARHPHAVEVKLIAPEGGEKAVAKGSPWGAQLSISANGSYTKQYRTVGGESVLSIQYITRKFRAGSFSFFNTAINRQPPLRLDDGTVASLDTNAWDVHSGVEAAYSFTDEWAIGIGSYHGIADDKAQSRVDSNTRAAIAYNFFAPDDPRGNKLEFFYHLGARIEKYNLPNELHEGFAAYPVHGVDAQGSVRKDKFSYGITLESNIQLDRPARRYSLTAAPFVSFQLGAHVDLSLNYSITKRQLPPPDRDAIDPSDFAQISRLQFAEPLSMSGSVGLTIHFDPTNGARNNRLSNI